MRRKDAMDDGKADARTLGFGREERIENTFEILGRYSDPVVGDLEAPRPSVPAVDAVPAPHPRLDQGVPGERRAAAPPDGKGRPGRAARVLREHAPRIAVLGEEGSRVTAQSLFVQDRPGVQVVPFFAPALAPEVAVVGHPLGGSCQLDGEGRLLEEPPLVAVPAFACEGFVE